MGSIDEVAARAGVSIATVSRALRGLPNVAESTRRRVRRAADELGYEASPHAAGLAGGATRTVGVVVPHVDRWFFGRVIAGAEPVLRAAGYDLLLYSVADQGARERFFARLPFRRRVDAVLVLALPLNDDESAAVRQLGVPTAVVGASLPGFAGVRIDDVAGARVAVEHLADLGHTRIAMIAGEGSEPMHFTAPFDRCGGYRAAIKERGLDDDPALEVPGRFTVEGGRRAMGELLALPTPPTAVFAQSDEMAFGAIRAAFDAGVRLPEDVSLVGFDDHDLADLVGLTTIAQPVVGQGASAAQLLLDALRPGGQLATDTFLMPTRLVVRATTGPPGPRGQAAPVHAAEAASLPVPPAPVPPGAAGVDVDEEQVRL